jgi:tetratricopeptide (TPR) repeat protein
VALAGTRATRALLELTDGHASFRRELYFIAARGRAVVLILDAPRAAVALYRSVFGHIAATLRLTDSPLAGGWALLAEGKARDAISRLEEALPGPRRVLALRALARAHREVGEIQTSLARAEEAVRLSPKSPQVRAELCEALQAAGRTEDARRILAEARRLAGSDVRALLGLAETATEVGLHREAVELYQEIVAARRDLYSAYNSLAWILATAKDPAVRDPARAERLARAAVEGHRWKDPAFIDTLAEAQYAAGRPQDAVATAEKALALTPDDDYLKRQLARFRAAAARVPADGGAR